MVDDEFHKKFNAPDCDSGAYLSRDNESNNRRR
jgi:hypothetical protein